MLCNPRKASPTPFFFEGLQIAVVWDLRKALLLLNRRLVYQHDGDLFLHGINTPALGALQALGILPILESVLACRTDQNFEQFFGDHVRHSTPQTPTDSREGAASHRKQPEGWSIRNSLIDQVSQLNCLSSVTRLCDSSLCLSGE